MPVERLDKLMIDATGHGYYQADDADPDEAVTPYAKARAREDALLKALKAVLDLHCSMDMGETSTQARLLIREIKATR
jgi:hypothetical protein